MFKKINLTITIIIFISNTIFAKDFIEVYFNSPPKANNSYTNPFTNIDDAFTNFLNTAQPGDEVYITIYNLNNSRIKSALLSTVKRIGSESVYLIYEKANSNNITDIIGPGKIENYCDDGTLQSDKLMHNKFAVIKNKCVWTGSYNFTDQSTFRDNNNAIVIHSSEIANCYEAEFKNMYDTKKFGSVKSSTTANPWWNGKIFNVNGTEVEVWFAPYKNPIGVSKKIVEEIDRSSKNIYFAIYTFGTNTEIENKLIAQHNKGILVSGVIEKQQSFSSVDNMKSAGLNIVDDTNTDLMHHKFAVFDISLPGAKILTGSYNWTNTADNSNDENIVILKSPVIAYKYYHEFQNLYIQSNQQKVINVNSGLISDITLFPSPADKYLKIGYILGNDVVEVNIDITTVSGRRVKRINPSVFYKGEYNESYWELTNDYGNRIPPGLYLVNIIIKDKTNNYINSRQKVVIK